MMRSPLLLATSLGLFLAGSGSLRAANDPPATPPVPATAAPETTTVTQTTAAPATQNGDVGVTYLNAAPNAYDKAWARVFMLGSHGSLPDKRVSVDEKNAKIKDVLKSVLDQAKIDYVFEQDVPDDAKVSVKLDNVQLATAIDAITDSTGLNWGSETRDGKVIVHVGKSIKPERSVTGLYSGPGINWRFAPGNPYESTEAVNKLLAEMSKNTAKVLGATGKTLNDVYQTTPGSNIVVTPYSTSPFTLNYASRETRSTFTCPNCHNQVTILRKNVAPKCTTCGRAFEPGWKVCPFDGAKRPEAKDDWKFCPICGKPIPEGILSYEIVPEGFPLDPNLDWYSLVTPAPLRIEDAQHALYHELSGAVAEPAASGR